MSGYVRATKLDEEFDGEKVTGSLQPLSLPDLLRLQSTQVGSDEDAARVLAEIVPKYVKDFAGLTAADGSAVPIEEVCASGYFVELAMAIGRKLVLASRPPQKPSETSAS
jgi:hypothetical protein